MLEVAHAGALAAVLRPCRRRLCLGAAHERLGRAHAEAVRERPCRRAPRWPPRRGAPSSARACPSLSSPVTTFARTRGGQLEQAERCWRSSCGPCRRARRASPACSRARLHEAIERLGELDRVEVLALDVLDQRELERRLRRDVLDDDERPRAGPPSASARQRRSPAMISNLSLPGDAPHDERLEEPVLADRLARAPRASASSKCCRGWPFCGTIFSIGHEKTLLSPYARRRRRRRGQERVEPAPERRVASDRRARSSRASPRLLAARRLAASRSSRASAQVALRALRLHVVEERGLAVRRRLAEAHVARDDGRRTRGSASSPRRRPGARGCSADRTS